MREIKWVINVGDSFKEEKRDITIIERKIRRVKRTDNKTKKEYIANEKWYKYHCNKCGKRRLGYRRSYKAQRDERTICGL